jgi:hypothetical protein
MTFVFVPTYIQYNHIEWLAFIAILNEYERKNVNLLLVLLFQIKINKKKILLSQIEKHIDRALIAIFIPYNL